MNDKEKEILAEIERLAKGLTDPTTVSAEEMDRLHQVFGSEQAIMNYKRNQNQKIQTEIERLQGLLMQ